MKHPLKTALTMLKTENHPASELVRQGTQWQPIETAPKNGERLLLWCEYNILTSGYWHLTLEAWVCASWGGEVTPTHWMPLPPEPEKKGKTK